MSENKKTNFCVKLRDQRRHSAKIQAIRMRTTILDRHRRMEAMADARDTIKDEVAAAIANQLLQQKARNERQLNMEDPEELERLNRAADNLALVAQQAIHDAVDNNYQFF